MSRANRIMESEVEALERGANLLRSSQVEAANSPAISAIERALEILLRNEAERTRYKLRGGKSLAQLFPDKAAA